MMYFNPDLDLGVIGVRKSEHTTISERVLSLASDISSLVLKDLHTYSTVTHMSQTTPLYISTLILLSLIILLVCYAI